MGRIYTIEFENQSITNAGGDRDFFYAAPASNKPIKILGWKLVQHSDLGDTEEEVLRYRLIRGHATVGSGGSTVTPVAMYPSDTAASFTARTNDTTIASAGTAKNVESGGFNIRVGDYVLYPPEYRPQCTNNQSSIVLRLMAGPADDVTMNGTMWIEEEG